MLNYVISFPLSSVKNMKYRYIGSFQSDDTVLKKGSDKLHKIEIRKNVSQQIYYIILNVWYFWFSNLKLLLVFGFIVWDVIQGDKLRCLTGLDVEK